MGISSSRSRAAARSAASSATVQAGWWCSWRASIPIASGRYPHSRVISGTAGSARRPARPAGQPDQQAGRLRGRQGVQADHPRVLQRGQVPPAGDQHQAPRRYRAAAGAPARCRRRHRAPAATACRPAGPATAPSAPPARPESARRGARVSSRLASASAGSTGRCPGVCPCSGRKTCPSGNRPRQPVRGVHRERGLADPGHPADGVDVDHPAQPPRPPCRPAGPARLPAGERGDVARQRPGAPRPRLPAPGPAGRQHLAAGTPARDGHEQLAHRPGQAQRIGQQPGRVLAGGPVDAPFQVTDRARAQARRLRQLLLGQPRLGPQLPQQRREPDQAAPPPPSTPLKIPPAAAGPARTGPTPTAYAHPISPATPPASASRGNPALHWHPARPSARRYHPVHSRRRSPRLPDGPH